MLFIYTYNINYYENEALRHQIIKKYALEIRYYLTNVSYLFRQLSMFFFIEITLRFIDIDPCIFVLTSPLINLNVKNVSSVNSVFNYISSD